MQKTIGVPVLGTPIVLISSEKLVISNLKSLRLLLVCLEDIEVIDIHSLISLTFLIKATLFNIIITNY